MRRAVFLILLLSCKPKGPEVGTKERLQELSADLRSYVAHTYPGCELGTSVAFDGKSKYTGRAFRTNDGVTTALEFALEDTTWRCVNAESSVPNSTTPCQTMLETCK